MTSPCSLGRRKWGGVFQHDEVKYIYLNAYLVILSEQTEKSVKENRTQPNESTDSSEPFLDFGEEDLKLDDESEFAGQLTKIEKKAPPKNGE